jgi:hypothetical protein
MVKEPSFSLCSLLNKEKLKRNGINFMDWHHNLRIIPKYEKKEYNLTETSPNKLSDKTEKSVREK